MKYYTKQDLLDLVIKSDIPVDIINRVVSLIKSLNFEKSHTEYYLDKGVADEHFKEPITKRVFQLMRDLDTLDDFDKIVQAPLRFNVSSTVGNIYSMGIPLPEHVIKELFNVTTTDVGGSAVGPGEILLALLFRNISNKTEGAGDLLLNSSKTLELKGSLGRFGSQPGRGPGTEFVNTSLYKYLHDASISYDLEDIFLEFSNSKQANDLGQTILFVGDNFIKTEILSEQEAYEETLSTLKPLYWNYPINEYLKTDMFTKDRSDLRKTFCKINAASYMKKIEADYIMVVNRQSGTYVVIKPSTIDYVFNNMQIDSAGYHKFSNPHPSMAVIC